MSRKVLTHWALMGLFGLFCHRAGLQVDSWQLWALIIIINAVLIGLNASLP